LALSRSIGRTLRRRALSSLSGQRSAAPTAPGVINDKMVKISKVGKQMRNGKTNSKGYTDRIIRDSRICNGQPVFKGTRVTLRTVLASLAGGDSVEEILADFPSLKPEDVQAAIAFAAASAEEDLPVPAAPDVR
jgi:uncharacterized protein (DUF433 family)